MENSFVVKPVNDIQGSLEKFTSFYPWIKEMNLQFKTESQEGPMKIRLIHWDKAKSESFIPAPSPYLLGLGIEYPEVIEKYGFILSPDSQNLFFDENGSHCYLNLCKDGPRNRNWTGPRILGLVPTFVDRTGWWCAVIDMRL